MIWNEYGFLAEDDFKTDLDLQLACLILHLQVKLINGNETNILVPEEWLKTYLRNQEQSMEQTEPQQLETAQPRIESMY